MTYVTGFAETMHISVFDGKMQIKLILTKKSVENIF